MEKIDLIMKKNKKSNKSLLFLIFVIIITAGLFGGNHYMSSQNEKLQGDIQEIKSKVASLESEDRVQTYVLVNSNKKILEKMDYKSQITFFIDDVDAIASKYGLLMKGFNFSNGNVLIQTAVRSDELGLAYKKVKTFIASYRTDPEAIYKLDFIGNISGSDIMKLNVKFQVK